MISLADYFGDYLSNRYADNPAFPTAPQGMKSGLGREGLLYLAQSMMSNPSLIGGISSGLSGAGKMFDSGMAGYAKSLREQQDQEMEMRVKELQMQATTQQMELARHQDVRAGEQLGLEKERVKLEGLKYEQDLAEWGLNKQIKESQLRGLARDEQEAIDKQTAALFAANRFGKTPEQKALYVSMARAGDVDQMWQVIKQQSFPDPYRERWSSPENQPGIGMVQKNQYGEVRVLHPEFKPYKDEPTISPKEISASSINILIRELIPQWNKQREKELTNRPITQKIGDFFGGGDGQPKEPMTTFGGQEIPSRLLEESENLAVQRYVTSIQKVQSLRQEQPKVNSVSSLPSSGNPVKDFSSKLALDRAIKDRINKDPAYAGMSPEQKQQTAKQIFEQIKQQIESGQGTYDQAIRQFSLQ